MPPAADPEPVQIGVQIGVRVRCTDPEILVQRLPGAAAERQGAVAASMVAYLVPLVAIVLGAMVLDEHLRWNLLAGAGLVLVGVAISEGRRSKVAPSLRSAWYSSLRDGPSAQPPDP
jgi:EamA-like transporter family